jgi:hypothetical protein
MKRDIRGELSGIIPDNLIHLVSRSFDVIGSKGWAVAVIEIPEELEPYGRQVGEALIRVQRNVKSVLSKGTERMGEFRVREMRLLAGDSNTEVLHKESGCIFKVDPAKAYFSPRESTEGEGILEGPLVKTYCDVQRNRPIRHLHREETTRVPLRRRGVESGWAWLLSREYPAKQGHG